VRVLLIGGSGFIGQRVITRLQQRGHSVIIFHRGHADLPLDPRLEVITGNRLEIDQYVADIEAARPDAAIDFLPWTDTDTRRVISALHGRVERVVHLSSGDVYQAWGNFLTGEFGEPVPLAEDAPLRTRLYPYAGTEPGMETYDKILAERAILKAHYDEGYPGVILRLPMVYGPGDPHHRMWAYVKRMLDNRPAILLSGRQAAWLRQRGYVDDVAFGIVLAAERATSEGQIYNVGNLRTHTLAAWIRAIGDQIGWRGEVRVIPDDRLPGHLASPYNYQQHIIYDTSKIRRELGYYELVDAEEALRLTVGWQRENPPHNGNHGRFDYEAEDAALRGLAESV
jgi:nucleoside-diphosphate-sugar epimerase